MDGTFTVKYIAFANQYIVKDYHKEEKEFIKPHVKKYQLQVFVRSSLLI